MNRIRIRIRPEVAEEQYGFRIGKGTAIVIFILRMPNERAIEMQRDVYLCFKDYEKAFIFVKHEEILRMLSRLELDEGYIRLVRNM